MSLRSELQFLFAHTDVGGSYEDDASAPINSKPANPFASIEEAVITVKHYNVAEKSVTLEKPSESLLTPRIAKDYTPKTQQEKDRSNPFAQYDAILFSSESNAGIPVIAIHDGKAEDFIESLPFKKQHERRKQLDLLPN